MQGNLRIGATSPYYVLGLIKDFRERYPQIEVSVEIGNSQQVLEALYECRVDLAASSQPVDDVRLTHLVLGRDPLVLAVRNHPLAARRSVALVRIAQPLPADARSRFHHPRADRGHAPRSRVAPASMLEIGSRELIRGQ